MSSGLSGRTDSETQLMFFVKEKRSFKIDLSKCEYTEGKAERELDHLTIYVYTPSMIAVEKVRAICQQMHEYPHTGVVGGLLVSQFLTLYITPVIYLYLEGLHRRLQRKKKVEIEREFSDVDEFPTRRAR